MQMDGLKLSKNLWTEVTFPGQKWVLLDRKNWTVFFIKIKGHKCRFPNIKGKKPTFYP